MTNDKWLMINGWHQMRLTALSTVWMFSVHLYPNVATKQSKTAFQGSLLREETSIRWCRKISRVVKLVDKAHNCILRTLHGKRRPWKAVLRKQYAPLGDRPPCPVRQNGSLLRSTSKPCCWNHGVVIDLDRACESILCWWRVNVAPVAQRKWAREVLRGRPIVVLFLSKENQTSRISRVGKVGHLVVLGAGKWRQENDLGFTCPVTV